MVIRPQCKSFLRSVRYFSLSRRIFEEGLKSSCKAGTPLNLKIKKNGNEPVALEDHEYPEWLWKCLDKGQQDADLKENDIMKWRRKQLNKANTAKINNNNFLANMK